MRQKPSPKLIGIFVLGAIFILVTSLVMFSSKQLFEEKEKYVLYFEESLNGLAIGSPVKYKGVQVGSVVDINVDVYFEKNEIETPVIIEIEASRLHGIGKRQLDSPQMMKELIKKGLRGQLKMQSFVTGQLYIEFNFHQNVPVRMVKSNIALLQIPTAPSGISEISDTLESVKGAFQGINELVNSPELKQAITSFNATMAGAQKSLSGFDTTMNSAQNSLTEFDTTMGSAQDTLVKYERLADSVSILIASLNTNVDPLAEKLDVSLGEFDETMASIRYLADYLSRHPEALVMGKGDPTRKKQ